MLTVILIITHTHPGNCDRVVSNCVLSVELMVFAGRHTVHVNDDPDPYTQRSKSCRVVSDIVLYVELIVSFKPTHSQC